MDKQSREHRHEAAGWVRPGLLTGMLLLLDIILVINVLLRLPSLA